MPRFVALLLLPALAGCGSELPDGTPDSAVSFSDADASLGDAGEKAGATYWYTCGDPVCRGWTRDRSIPLCRTQTVGDSCRKVGKECDIRGDGCNTHIICATSDPATTCPISRRAYKSDISYLSGSEVDAVRDDLMAMPLARWNYTAEGIAAATHLGFIIDDNPESPAVSEGGETVDLYGYTSMTVAAVQAQQRQIDALEVEVKALRAELAASRAGK